MTNKQIESSEETLHIEDYKIKCYQFIKVLN